MKTTLQAFGPFPRIHRPVRLEFISEGRSGPLITTIVPDLTTALAAVIAISKELIPS